jgi:hypothetical protein
MNRDGLLEGLFIILPIILLLLVGAGIAVRSGVGEVTTGRDYLRIAGNVSAMLLRIAGYVVVFLAVQHLIGLRPSLGW